MFGLLEFLDYLEEFFEEIAERLIQRFFIILGDVDIDQHSHHFVQYVSIHFFWQFVNEILEEGFGQFLVDIAGDVYFDLCVDDNRLDEEGHVIFS